MYEYKFICSLESQIKKCCKDCNLDLVNIEFIRPPEFSLFFNNKLNENQIKDLSYNVHKIGYKIKN